MPSDDTPARPPFYPARTPAQHELQHEKYTTSCAVLDARTPSGFRHVEAGETILLDSEEANLARQAGIIADRPVRFVARSAIAMRPDVYFGFRPPTEAGRVVDLSDEQAEWALARGLVEKVGTNDDERAESTEAFEDDNENHEEGEAMKPTKGTPSLLDAQQAAEETRQHGPRRVRELQDASLREAAAEVERQNRKSGSR